MRFGAYYVIDNIVNKIIIDEEPTNIKNNLKVPKFIFKIAHKVLYELNKCGICEIDFAIEINRKLIWFNGGVKYMRDIFKYDSSNSVIYKINIIDEPKEKNHHKYIMQHIIKYGVSNDIILNVHFDRLSIE